jgi:hypothetical protein
MLTMPTRHDAPLPVEVHVDGLLDAHWSAWFDDLALTHEADGTTTLRGTVTDQAHLFGVLARIRDLGVHLISVTARDTDDDTAPPAGRE